MEIPIDILPIITAVVVMLGLFITIMGFKHRDEEEQKEEEDSTTSSEDEIKKLLKIKPWKRKR